MNLKVKYAVLKGLTIVPMVLSLYLFLISDDPKDCLLFLAIYFTLALILYVFFLMESFEEIVKEDKHAEQED